MRLVQPDPSRIETTVLQTVRHLGVPLRPAQIARLRRLPVGQVRDALSRLTLRRLVVRTGHGRWVVS